VQAIEMIKKLWKMRTQVRSLGPDDRAAVVALSAEMTRNPVEVEGDEVIPKLTDDELMEALNAASHG
jgi:hypothetical protein